MLSPDPSTSIAPLGESSHVSHCDLQPAQLDVTFAAQHTNPWLSPHPLAACLAPSRTIKVRPQRGPLSDIQFVASKSCVRIAWHLQHQPTLKLCEGVACSVWESILTLQESLPSHRRPSTFQVSVIIPHYILQTSEDLELGTTYGREHVSL